MESNQKTNLFAVAALALIAILSSDVRGAVFQSMAINSGSQVAAVATTCPAGYVCTGSDVYNGAISVATSPTLKVNYDSNKTEVTVTATFSVTVSGGTTGINVYKNDGLVSFIGLNTYKLDFQPLLSSGALTTVVDDQGQTMYVVPAGQSKVFTASVSYNASGMIPDTYYATLSYLMLNSGTFSGVRFPGIPSDNKTNSKTVIGETSPYIINFSTSNAAIPGQKVTINGTRLQNTVLFIDNVRQYNASVNNSDNATAVSFILPTSTTLGRHLIQLQNGKGMSNASVLMVQSTPVYLQALAVTSMPNTFEYLLSSTKPFGMVVYTALCNPNEIDINTNSGLTCGSSVTIMYTANSTRVDYPISYVSKDGLSHKVVITAKAVADTGQVGSSSASVTVLPTVTGCYTFTTNLDIGSSGPDVATLQTILMSKGYYIEGVSTGDAALGYFGPGTANAVKQFQAASGLPATGFVGPLTRALLNACVPTVKNPSITVVSPNGGEVLQVGQTYRIKWNSSGVDKVSILLDSPGIGTWVQYQIPNIGYYDWTVSKGDAINNSQFKISLTGWPAGSLGNPTDNSDDFFTISTSSPTVIPTVTI